MIFAATLLETLLPALMLLKFAGNFGTPYTQCSSIDVFQCSFFFINCYCTCGMRSVMANREENMYSKNDEKERESCSADW